VTVTGIEAKKLPRIMGNTTKRVTTIGVIKITIPLTTLPTYICPTPGMRSDRIAAMISSFLE
jgi:hypothetical protein